VSFTELGLAPELTRAVREQGYETPTPIQEKAIPGVLAGRDLIGCAQTGTGKTAAFTLPILHRLLAGAGAPAQAGARAHVPAGASPRGRLRALILTPTRELALQVEESLRTYGRHLRLASAVIHGGVGHQPQEDNLRRGIDVLVATPGRLLDHMSRGTVDYRNLEVLVLDEADRMLDMGFIRDVRRIVRALPARRQTLLFSATMPDEIRRLAKEILRDPVNVEVAPRRSAPAAGVRQTLLPVDTRRKRDLMSHLLETEARGLTLIFTRTKHGANKLARHLEGRGHAVALLHGNRSQPQRTKALDSFRAGRARVMVATDIAGRGIDVDGIAHVVNYDLPNVPEDYVHRIGRTARAGATGDALSLLSPEDHPHVRGIESLIGHAIERRIVQGFADGSGAPRSATAAPQSAAAPARPGAAGAPRFTAGAPRSGAATAPRSAAAAPQSSAAAAPRAAMGWPAKPAPPRRHAQAWRGRGVRRAG
jgi:ATP-dependent RNA helicase RhlE